MEQDPQPVGIQLVGLVDQAHHQLGLGGMGQERLAAGGLDLIDDPVPVADGFQRHRRPRREL